ncbi:MAG: ABC transporter ATP-binding protein [Bdellovibrionales bacterium]
MNVLKVESLRKSYKRGFIPKKTEVLKGVNFTVQAGKITGFLGANGAGKTTTMRCVLGLDSPDSGTVLFFGQPLDQQARRKVGFLPERPYFYEHLSGREFLEFYAGLSGVTNNKRLQDKIEELFERVDLSFAQDRQIRNYSKGMLQKVGLAQALIHEPEFIILDEPMSGLDPDGRLALSEIILDTAKRGTAIFFSSHLLHDMERLCENLVVIKDGFTIFEGTTETLMEKSSLEFEISFLDQGHKKVERVGTQEQAQDRLVTLVKEGAVVLEMRRIRATLEEVFVRMALKGGRK